MAKKSSTARAGSHLHHERSDYERLKSRPVISIGSTYRVVDEGIETYTLTGDFEKDFYELCSRNDVPAVKVAPRPHRPSSPTAQHLDTSMSKGKESKEDRSRNHIAPQPPVDQAKSSEDDQEPAPTTFTMKDKYDYFQPRLEIESEDEGNKSYVKELFIRGWKVDKKMMEVLLVALPKQDRLVSINLWNAGLEDSTLEQLSKIVLQCTGLKDLCLDGNAYIRKHRYDLLLKEESSLQNLSLKNCYVNDIGALNIGNALLENKHLLTLNLCFNKITCVGAGHLAVGLRMNRTLLSLNLGSNLIKDAGCFKLAESLTRFALTHKEVVQRRYLLSKKSTDERASPVRGLTSVNSTQRPPSVKSGHLKDDKKSRSDKGATKKKDGPQKQQKDAMSKKGSSTDVPSKTSTKTPKKAEKAKQDKKGAMSSEQESPELIEFPHPLLENTEEINGELWIPGNRSLINLNLARNKITIESVKELLQTVQYQSSLANQLNRVVGIGLLRLSLQRNSFDPSDPHYTQLSEIMFSRDPFNKQPQSASTSKDQIKDES